MKARYFYHSFARRSPADENGYGKELQILQSMLDVGLLLTPERIEFKERLRDGSYSEPATIFQKRICFTELSEEELPAHCTNFGEFSIEWDQEIHKKWREILLSFLEFLFVSLRINIFPVLHLQLSP